MSCLRSCTLNQMLNIISSVKVTLFTFNKVSFVRNTCATISLLYYNLIKCICKSTLLKMDIIQKEPIKSV